MRVSVVIPAYNEEKRLPPFLSSIADYWRRHQADIREVIVVDDGSSDATVAVAQTFTRRLPTLRIIRQPENRGKGAAVKAGVMSARGDGVVFIDADGATAITELPKMLTVLEEADVAIGNRWMKGAAAERHSFLRSLSGWVNRTYMRLFRLGDIDTMCGFKGYRLPVARALFADMEEERWLFDTEIALRARLRGYRIVNFPIRWVSKDGSKLSTRTLIAAGIKIWPLVRRVRRQERAKRN